MPLLSFISGRKQSARRTTTPPEVQKASSPPSIHVGGPESSLGSRTRSLESLQAESLRFSPASSTASFVSTASESYLNELPASSNASFVSTASEDYNAIEIFSFAINGMHVPVPPPPPQKDLDSNLAPLGQEWMKVDDSSDDDSSDSGSSDDEYNDGGSFMSAHHEPFLQNLPYGHGAAESINPSKKAKASSESILLVEEPENVILQLKQKLNVVHMALSEAQNQCSTLQDRNQVQEERIKSQETLFFAAARSWKSDKTSATRAHAIEVESKDKEIQEVKLQLEIALLDSKAKAKMIEGVHKVLAERDSEIIATRDELKEVRSELAQSKVVCELLAKEQSGLIGHNETLQVQLASAQAIVEERDASIVRMREDEEARTRLTAGLEEDKMTLRLHLGSTQAIVEERNTTIEHMNRDATEKSKIIARKSKIIAGLEEDNAVLRLQLESTQAHADESDTIIARLRKDDAERTKLIAGIEEDKVALHILVQSTQARVEESDTTITCLKKEEVERTKLIAKLEDDKITLRLQLESTQARVDERDTTIAKMKEDETERTKCITQLEIAQHLQGKNLQVAVAGRETSMRRLKQMEDEKKKRISELEEEKESLRIQVEDLQADVAEHDATLEGIRKERDSNIISLKSNYSKLYKTSVRDRQKYSDEKKRLESELEELKQAKKRTNTATEPQVIPQGISNLRLYGPFSYE